MSQTTAPATDYITGVLSGEIVACKAVKLAVKRHQTDLKKGSERGLYFDQESAAKAIRFFSFLRHTKGQWAGQTFILEPWQCFIVYVLFGWKRADHSRRFRMAYIEVARKNGKTGFAAGIALYMLLADGEAGAEVYTAATTRDQAKICFTEAQNMVRKSPLLQKKATVFNHNIHVLSTASKMEAVSSDYNVLDGLNPHCNVLDELHAYKNSGLYDIMTSAMGARHQPLIFAITTAGFNKEWWCYQFRKSVIGVLQGKITDDSLFGIIYTLDENDSWQDPEVWVKANPNLNVSISFDYLKDKVHQATIRPSERVNVQTKNLNVWTDAEKTWIPDEQWAKGDKLIDESKLQKQVCYGGLDLASTTDFAALAWWFPAEDGQHRAVLRFWIPEDTVQNRIRAGLADLDDWVAKGWVRTTPGNVTDYNYIKADILSDFEQFDVQSMAVDRWNSSHLLQELDDELPPLFVDNKPESRLYAFGQGYRSMSGPTKALERFAMSGAINHGGNPVMRWMMGNVALRRDPAGNVKIDKEKSGEKVDGPVALVMAIGMHLHTMEAAPAQQESAYNSPDHSMQGFEW